MLLTISDVARELGMFFEKILIFVPVEKSSRNALTICRFEALGKYGVEVRDMRRQGYDHGAHMKGQPPDEIYRTPEFPSEVRDDSQTYYTLTAYVVLDS